MAHRRVRRPPDSLLAIVLIATIAVACGTRTPAGACAPIAFADGVATKWTQARAAVDFAPTRPCARDGRLRVTNAFVDSVPADGGGFTPRISQVIARDGEQVLVFSETRGPMPFRAIPNGTRSLVVALEGEPEPARGFVGTSPSGAAIAYLRWRAGGVTRELTAMLRPVFTEADLVELARDTAAAR